MSAVTAKAARGRMDQAREDTAKQVLKAETVTAAISDAAGKGLGQVLFAPPVGVSIKATKAAAVLIETLSAAGFRVGWRDRRDPGDVMNHELAVEWDTGAAS